MTAEVRVRVPASPGSLRLLRSVVGAIAARAGCSVDALADLRLAVDEAATRLLADRDGAETLVVEAQRTPHGVDVVVAAAGGAERLWPPAGLEGSLSWTIMDALVEDLRAPVTADGPAIAFRVPVDA